MPKEEVPKFKNNLDYSCKQRKFKDFEPNPDHQKYYINKKEYIVPPTIKTKGDEKFTPAVASLIEKRNRLKNKYQKMSMLEDHFKLIMDKNKSKANLKKKLLKGLTRILKQNTFTGTTMMNS